MTLSKTALTLKVGASESLSAAITPADADDKSGTWSSSDKATATVDQTGKVTAVAKGSVKIIFTTKDGGHKVECAVSVTE